MTYFRYTCVAAAAALLVACGGSDDSDRGALKDAPVTITTLTAAQIDAGTAAAGLQALSGKAKCDVKVVALNYITVGAQGNEETNASGVMLVPGGAACAAPAALVAYAKGTDMQKPRTLANPQDNETFLLAAMYAAQGYAVVATDYLGFAKSGYAYHPYLHADSEARTVIDSVRAARAAALRPISAGEKIEDGVKIQPRGVGTNGESITLSFDYLCHAASLSHHGIILK